MDCLYLANIFNHLLSSLLLLIIFVCKFSFAAIYPKYPVLIMANLNQKKYPAKDDFPNFEGHKSLLSKYLTADMYAKLRDVATPSGYTLDRAIQNGVDNPGT